MAQNMYRVGDCVYFEVSSSAPYQIRKIEELNKNATGQVEAKVMCFYRRRDISTALLRVADQAERKFEEYYEEDKMPEGFANSGHTVASVNGVKKEEKENGVNGDEKKEEKADDDDLSKKQREWGNAGLPVGAEKMNEQERHVMRQREVFVSRTVETLPATHIRGKCTVTLLSEVETSESYDRDDAFFYSLMYDPGQMTLLADKGAIRVGDKFQADMDGKKEEKAEVKNEDVDGIKENGDGLMIDEGEEEGEDEKSRAKDEKEVLVYHPHHSLSDRDIDQFLIIARAVGTFSRALDTSSSTKLPSLHMTAAAASRDVTLLHAMALLHQANYDIGQAVKFLVPPPSKEHYPLDADRCTSHKTVSLGGPILCRDQMEEWSAAEANLFEEAIEKYGKDFNDVRNDFLPWKSIRDIVEYYYMWKTTNRYVDVKKTKHQEQESKLKQVYIPNYNKPNANLVGPPNTSGQPVPSTTRPCESCGTELSLQWYAWGPAALQMRLCSECWSHWKKFGGLRKRNDFEHYDLEGTATDLSKNATNSVSLNKGLPQRLGISGIGGRPTQIVARVAGQTSKTARVSFMMRVDPVTKMARRISSKSATLLNLRKCARRPFEAIDQASIRNHCQRAEQTEVLKCAMSILKTDNPMNLPPPLVQAVSTGSIFSLKRPSNGGDLGPAAKRPTPLLSSPPQPPPPVLSFRDSLWQELPSAQRLIFVAGRELKHWRRRLVLPSRPGVGILRRGWRGTAMLLPSPILFFAPQKPETSS